MTLSKEAKVASLIIISIVVFVLGANFLRGSRFTTVDPVYYALFENVQSLYKSSKVYINGVQVGSVKEIEFENKEQLGKIKVTIQLNGKLPIPKDSKAIMYSTDLFGNKALRIDLGNSKELAKDGATLGSDEDMGMMGAISDKVSPLATNADKLLGNANTLFDRRQQENIYLTINNMNKVLLSLDKTINGINVLIAKNDHSISKSMGNIESITSNIEKKNAEISQLISNFNAISGQVKQADIGKTVVKLNKAIDELNQLLVSINDGNGTLSKLIKDPTLHNKLVETVNSANVLVQDLKANPKRYVSFSVFSKKN